jgi:DNA repair protein RadC
MSSGDAARAAYGECGERGLADEQTAEAASSGAEARQPPRKLPAALRPRQRLLAKGARALSQRELLALVLGTGNRVETASKIASRLVRRHGLEGLAGLSAEAWQSEKGLGSAAAARLCAVFELGRRAYGREDNEARAQINGPRQAFKLLEHLTRAKKEYLVGLYLDAQNGLLVRETISIGTLNTTRTHPREILYPAISHLALGFLLAHNHPSGCLEPSREDLEFTHSVQRAGELMGIELYDHLIIGRRGFTSLRERGLL